MYRVIVIASSSCFDFFSASSNSSVSKMTATIRFRTMKFSKTKYGMKYIGERIASRLLLMPSHITFTHFSLVATPNMVSTAFP